MGLPLCGKLSNSPASMASRILRSATVSHWSTDFSVTWRGADYRIVIVKFIWTDSMRRYLGILLCVHFALFAQGLGQHRTTVSVPFVGCRSDGQTGSTEAPKGADVFLSIDGRAAEQLAYYKSAQGLSVLAPRGWYCYGMWGSGGDTLFVGPEPIDGTAFSTGQDGFTGPLIELSRRLGDTSGRFSVAKIITLVFPAYRAVAKGVIDEFERRGPTFGPYPADKLTYKSKSMVRYRTPAQTDGLGNPIMAAEEHQSDRRRGDSHRRGC